MCQVCAKLRLTVKVRWPIIARSIDTHAFLPWRLLSIELVTVWRGFDSLRGFGEQGRAIDDGNIFFYFPFFPQTGVTRSGNSAQQKALHLFLRGLGGREGPLMAEIYIFCFPGFFPNMSGADRVYVSLGTAGTYPGYGPVYRNVPW